MCDYISYASNRGELETISSLKGTARSKGKTVTFFVGSGGGTCRNDEIQAEECEYGDCQLYEYGDLGGLNFPKPSFGDRGLKIVPFRGKYYVVTYGTEGVVDPESGPICDFQHDYHPVLTQDKSHGICQPLFDQKLQQNVPLLPFTADAEKKINDGLIQKRFDKYADVSFDGKQTVRVGEYGFSSGAACGCDYSGVAILNADGTVNDDAPFNKSLQEHEGCGAETKLIQSDGIVYVDVIGNVEGGEESHTLLKLNGDKFEPICTIDQVLQITPIKPKIDIDDDRTEK